jgi:hypothetical protein
VFKDSFKTHRARAVDLRCHHFRAGNEFNDSAPKIVKPVHVAHRCKDEKACSLAKLTVALCSGLATLV